MRTPRPVRDIRWREPTGVLIDSGMPTSEERVTALQAVLGQRLLVPGGLAAVGLPEAGAGCRIPPCTTRLQMAVRCGPLAGIAYRGVSGAEKGQEWRGCGGPAPACMKPMRPWQGNWRGAGGVRGEQSHCGRTTHGPGFRRSSPPTGLGLELELEVSSPNRRGQVQDSCAYELEPGIDTRSSS